MEKVTIGQSDYSREEMMDVDGSEWAIGSSFQEFLDMINYYENLGYIVKFETSIWRRIFGFGIYKIVAYK